jgi:hypothetical protein
LHHRRIKSSRGRTSSRKNKNLDSTSTREDIDVRDEDRLQMLPDAVTIELPVLGRNDLQQDILIESPLNSPIHLDTFPTNDHLDRDSRPSSICGLDNISNSNQVDARLYQESGVWCFPDSMHPGTEPRSIRAAVESDDEGSDDLEENAEDIANFSEEECLDDDSEGWGEDEIDIQPWLRGMPAINELDEEFEQEAAARGAT